jgi:hypothetical protein
MAYAELMLLIWCQFYIEDSSSSMCRLTTGLLLPLGYRLQFPINYLIMLTVWFDQQLSNTRSYKINNKGLDKTLLE